jgi:hypothetical protein
LILAADNSDRSTGFVGPDTASVTPDIPDVSFYINPAPGTRRVFGVEQ